MKYFNKILKLADKFEYKLSKYSESAEVDSTDVTLAIRPIINTITTNSKLQGNAEKIINKASEVATKNNETLSGDLEIGESFFTNANLIDGKWIINREKTGFKTSGSLLENKYAGEALKNLIRQTLSIIYPAMEKELNRLHNDVFNKNSPGCNKITDHEVYANKVFAKI